MYTLNDVCAVITTFRPEKELRNLVAGVAKQVGHVIVVDDTGDLGGSVRCESGVSYVVNSENLGIAKALNIGVELATEKGYAWILTLDDDTRIADDYVSRVLEFCNRARDLSLKVGVVALSRGEPSQFSGGPGVEFRRKNALITSGSLFCSKAIGSAGGFDNRLFIDLVDIEFCTRLRRNGFDVIQVMSPGMEHHVGNLSVKRILGLQVNVYNHEPFRLYYQVRNAIVFFKTYCWTRPILSTYVLLDIVRIPAKSVVYEPEKRRRLLYVLHGIRDGVVGRLGRIDFVT